MRMLLSSIQHLWLFAGIAGPRESSIDPSPASTSLFLCCGYMAAQVQATIDSSWRAM